MGKNSISTDKTYLGIELGSTRIKACLIDDTYKTIASGSFEWENYFDGTYWTYSLESIHMGVRECYKSLSDDVFNKYGVVLESVGAIGISAMMHGYLVFDENDKLLVPFRTWRNTTTEKAAEELTNAFNFNIPQRWSVSHLYQAILNNEPHIHEIAHITTLAGYIQFLLTGNYEVGIGDASGIFPVNGDSYDSEMLDKFDSLIENKHLSWKIREILPKIKKAGEKSSCLTKNGAAFLDPTGKLDAGIFVCPPEGDAGTGMVATNSVSPKTGNISAGTSIFSMLVLEKPLAKIHSQIDIVTTPDGHPVAMVHCNNCCNELDAWVNIFGEFSELMGINLDKQTLYQKLYNNAMNGDCSGIMPYNYLSGEHITNIKNGRPMYFRLPQSKMSLAGFMKAQLYSAVATMSIGMDILFKEEKVKADVFFAHGGLFKVEGVAQQIVADALDTSVSVAETAGEGGAWGMALLAAYMMDEDAGKLSEWLESKVFLNQKVITLNPVDKHVREFENFKMLYKKGLVAEKELNEVK